MQDHHEMGLNRTKMFVSVNEKAKSAASAGHELAGTLHEWGTLPFPQPSPYRGQLQLLLQTRHPPSWQQQQINTLAFVLPLWVQTINKYHFTRRGLSSSRLQDSFANVPRGHQGTLGGTGDAARLANLSSFN